MKSEENGVFLTNLEICTLLASVSTTNPEAKEILQQMQEHVNRQIEQEHQQQKRKKQSKLEM